MTECAYLLVCIVSIPQYLSKFQWDFAKYSTKQSLRNIAELIAKVFCHLLLSVFAVIML